MKIEQVTRERKRAACQGPGCGTIVVHVQLAGFTGGDHKVYQFVPIGHRRPDGARCTHLAEERKQAWKIQRK